MVFFHLICLCLALLDGDNRDITFSNRFQLPLNVWNLLIIKEFHQPTISQVEMIIQESPANSQRGRRRSSVGWPMKIYLFFAWWKAPSPKESIGEQFNILYLNLFVFVRILFLNLSAAIWLWLLYIFTFDLISLIVFVAPLRLYVWWWFCSWKWLWLQTYGTSGFVQTLHISMHHVKSMEVTHPMWEMLLVFSTGDESSVVYDQHGVPVCT